ncbi:glycosyltransferase [Paenibacillus nasutitermitis]|uniref:Glycosyl transferase n=1 Tax=Paenibacillus nasutitermitis TaxID=1652958 RepID=A0A916Z2Q9_9BACL|nr:glycosyltransferase [Paenibacillus nasutitermitis]GGD73282.1 glycosyl transferase [Paenibacillus nasutitermitis]
MKKSLLFVMPSLASGGGERSLVNLLSQIDYSLYEVDLFLFNHEGLFMEFVPKEVTILPIPESYYRFAQPLAVSAGSFLIRGDWSLARSRLLFSLKNRLNRNMSMREQYNWKYISASIGLLQKKYDAAIGFLEKTSTYFCVEKVEALQKIGWVHIDYDELGMDPDFDITYFEQLDHIVTVSEECAAVLKKRFPGQQHKVQVIHNIVSPTVIRQMAEENLEDVYNREGDEIVLLTVGRLHVQKGYELAIEACRLLVEQGYNIRWYVIGEGEERAKLTELIKASRLERHFKLLGLKSNPYPYIKQADLYVQTSRFEGKSIAIDEAKILKKPIVITRFSTAADQIREGQEGLIVEMHPEAIAKGIGKLIHNRELRIRMANHLAGAQLGTEAEIYQLYSLLNREFIHDKTEAL